jgi:hypothetical protein
MPPPCKASYANGPDADTRNSATGPKTNLEVAPLQEFPIADHDDGPDAVEMALRLAAEVLNTRTLNDGLGHRLPIG